MSRDPLDGSRFAPKSLHKYLYAEGDPINGLDSRGREDLEEDGGILSSIIKKAAPTIAALTEGAQQAAATIGYYAGLVYFTINDFLATTAANEYVGCITLGVMVVPIFDETNLTDDDKEAAIITYKNACGISPWNYPDF